MMNWEYKLHIVTGGNDVVQSLNEQGSEGWEAVAIETHAEYAEIYFKRPKPWDHCRSKNGKSGS